MTQRRKHDNVVQQAAVVGSVVQRLRKAREMSLDELSELSGVAKSIISRIERNETNPTLATMLKLADALGLPPHQLLAESDSCKPIIQHQKRRDIPLLISEDGKCRLHIIGALELVEWVQWYDFQAEPGGVLASEPHQPGCVEHLHVLRGVLEVRCGDTVALVRAGETLRYRGDLPHVITNVGQETAQAVMVLILQPIA